MSRNRCWCFTINHPSESDWYAVRFLAKKAVFMVYAKEFGESGTEHIQGYFRGTSPLSLSQMKKYLARAHLQIALGTDKDNLIYIQGPFLKDGKHKEYNDDAIVIGEPTEGQGKRNDLEEIAQLIKNNSITMKELMFEHPIAYLKYSRSFEKMFNAVLEERCTLPEVHWRWGLSGTGKTRYCIEKHPSHYIKDNTVWWDMYNQEEAVIFDDFDNQLPFRVLLRILDRNKYPAQIKGGYTQLNSPFIYITCEFPPTHFWSGNALVQVDRRLTSVLEIK